MISTSLSAKRTTAVLTGAAICVVAFTTGLTAAHAQSIEDTDTTVVNIDDSSKRAKMMEQIAALKETIANHKASVKEDRKEMREDHKEAREENKAEMKVDREEFMASLEGLSEEEKRAAMLEFITKVKASIEAKKAMMQDQVAEKKEKHEEVKEQRLENREEFQASLEGLSQQDKVKAITKRLKAIATQIDSDKKEASKTKKDTTTKVKKSTEADFHTLLQAEVLAEIGQPIEGYEPTMFLKVLPGLLPEDFDGVDAQTGSYVYANGELKHEVKTGELLHSSSPAITKEGVETLFKNIVNRFPGTLTVEEVMVKLKTGLKAEESNESKEVEEEGLVACTMDARQCSDGSYVGRTGPACAFAECPEVVDSSGGSVSNSGLNYSSY